MWFLSCKQVLKVLGCGSSARIETRALLTLLAVPDKWSFSMNEAQSFSLVCTGYRGVSQKLEWILRRQVLTLVSATYELHIHRLAASLVSRV